MKKLSELKHKIRQFIITQIIKHRVRKEFKNKLWQNIDVDKNLSVNIRNSSEDKEQISKALINLVDQWEEKNWIITDIK